jgi:hypothetical protein
MMVIEIELAYCWTCRKWTQHDVEKELIRQQLRPTRQTCRDCHTPTNIQSNVSSRNGGGGDQRYRTRRARA